MQQLPVKSPWAEALALLVAVFGGGGLWAYLSARMGLKASPPAAMATSDAHLVEAAAAFTERFGDAAGGLIERYLTALRAETAHREALETKVDGLVEKVEACEARHDDCEARLTRAEAAWTAERALLKASIDRLMDGEVADLFAKPPRD